MTEPKEPRSRDARELETTGQGAANDTAPEGSATEDPLTEDPPTRALDGGTERQRVSGEPREWRATATGCQSAEMFDRLRRSPQMNPSFEKRLVGHLATPCPTCLDRLATLAPLSGVVEGPTPRLPPSEQASICALRTLGGWLPRRWLWVERRRALDAVAEPLGFLRLVVEEARQLPGLGFGLELRRWVEVVQGPAFQGTLWDQDNHPSHPLLARALLYLALDEHRRRHHCTALDLFDRAARLVDHFPDDAYLAALMAETYARLTEDRRASFAEGQYHLALARLVRSGDGPRRAEILIRQARGHVRCGEGEQALRLADRAMDALDDRLSPLIERSAHHVRALAALDEVDASPLGVPRLVAAARFAGHLAALSPVPLTIDAELSQEYVRMLGRLDELWDHHRFYWLEREVLPHLEGEDEAMVCAVMASAPDPGAPRYYERLVKLAGRPGIAERLIAQRPEVERWAKALGMVRGFPEMLRPLAEMLRRIEEGRGKR